MEENTQKYDFSDHYDFDYFCLFLEDDNEFVLSGKEFPKITELSIIGNDYGKIKLNSFKETNIYSLNNKSVFCKDCSLHSLIIKGNKKLFLDNNTINNLCMHYSVPEVICKNSKITNLITTTSFISPVLKKFSKNTIFLGNSKKYSKKRLKRFDFCFTKEYNSSEDFEYVLIPLNKESNLSVSLFKKYNSINLKKSDSSYFVGKVKGNCFCDLNDSNVLLYSDKDSKNVLKLKGENNKFFVIGNYDLVELDSFDSEVYFRDTKIKNLIIHNEDNEVVNFGNINNIHNFGDFTNILNNGKINSLFSLDPDKEGTTITLDNLGFINVISSLEEVFITNGSKGKINLVSGNWDILDLGNISLLSGYGRYQSYDRKTNFISLDLKCLYPYDPETDTDNNII